MAAATMSRSTRPGSTHRGRARRVIGVLLLAVGVVIMLYPLVSVRRISHRSLNELPRIEDVAVNDVSKDVFALLDEDFTLATRTYQGTDLETVEAALFAAGFDVLHGTTPSQNGFSLECCGEYDAIWVHLFEVDSGVVASTTAADSDIQLAWPISLFIGLFAAAAGALLVRYPRPVELTEHEALIGDNRIDGDVGADF